MVAKATPTPTPASQLETLTYKSLKRTSDMFLANLTQPPAESKESLRMRVNAKINADYGRVKSAKMDTEDAEVVAKVVDIDAAPVAPSVKAAQDAVKRKQQKSGETHEPASSAESSTLSKLVNSTAETAGPGKQLVTSNAGLVGALISQPKKSSALMPRAAPQIPKPRWRAPWKLYRVIAGHSGWVRSVDVDPSNEWFCTGANDRTIKIWDLASGTLKLTLTGHISAVTGLAVSPRHPYLFSVGEDKMVKCWDLETNTVVRSYHGHLSSCYDVKIHPTLDLIITASRDSTARVWDMRTKACVHVLAGHTDGVNGLAVQGANPQVTTVSYDTTVKLWDLAEGRVISTLTNHKKSVRAICQHPSEFNFATGSADNIKKWTYPNGDFQMNVDRHPAVVNSMAVNQDGVMVSGADNGTLQFYDWATGYNFQKYRAPPQPGSLASENGIYGMTFDQTGSRLITCEADKSIKFYKEDDQATEESHPVSWNPTLRRSKF